MGLVGVVALLALAAFVFFQMPGSGDANLGLEPEAPGLASEHATSDSELRDMRSENERISENQATGVEPEETAPVDWGEEPLGVWRGLVLSARGAQPLADSQVEFHCSAGVVKVQTDGQGLFEMSVPMGVEGMLIARHPGFLERAKPKVRSGPRVSMLLIPSASIVGEFYGPAEGLSASLLAVDSKTPGEPKLTTELGPDGTFLFEGLAPGLYSIRVGPGVYAVLKHVPLGAGERREVHLSALEATQLLEGRVLTQPGDQPVAQAQVWVGYHTIGIPRSLEVGTERSTVSDGEGRFEVFLGSGVRTNVHVVAPWGGEVRLPFLDATDWIQRGSVEVKMPAPAHLSGILQDLQGNGVAGATILLRKATSGKPGYASRVGMNGRFERSVLTGTGGEFDFEEIPARENLILILSGGQDDGDLVLASLKLKAGQHRSGLRLRSGLLATLSGNVLDLQGNPFSGVRLSVLNSDGIELVFGMSDAFGNYSIAEVPGARDKTLSILLSQAGEELHRAPLRLPKRPKGSTDVLLWNQDFRVARKLQIRGLVLDDEGYGVEGVRLHVVLKKGRRVPLGDGVSGQAGEFQFAIADVREGNVEISLRSRAWQLPKIAGRVWTLPLANPLIINVERAALEASAHVRGEVLIAGSSASVSRLRIMNARGGVLGTEGSRFSVRGIRSGRLRLKLRAHGMATLSLPALELSPGMDLDLGLVRMHRACDLTLEFRGLPKKLPKGSKLRLKSLSKYDWDPEWKAHTLDLTGQVKRRGSKPLQVVRRGIPRGRWRLEVQVPGFKKVSRELDLKKARVKIRVPMKRG